MPASPGEPPNQTHLLLQRLAAGDPMARAHLIEHSQTRFRHLAHRMLATFPALGRWEDTNDVLQGALIRLWGALNKITIESPAHYYRLAALEIRRELLDLTRRHFGSEGIGAHHHTDSRGGQDHAEAAGGRDLLEPRDLVEWEEFHGAIGRLPDAEREVFALIWYGGLSQVEIASLLKLSDRTVKRRWLDARLIVRRALDSERPP